MLEPEHPSNEPDRTFRLIDIIRRIKSLILLSILLLVIFMIWRQFFSDSAEKKELTTVETSSRLEKVLQISELSTYQVTFNGVADVTDDSGVLLYHTAYNAQVSIGLAMDQIKVSIDDTDPENKLMQVTLPDAEIADVNVDPGSLDYIFKDRNADTADVSVTSLPACIADAEADCRSNEELFTLARENAVRTVEALMQPFLAQNKEYTLKIAGKGGAPYVS